MWIEASPYGEPYSSNTEISCTVANHYDDVIMNAMASQITSLTIVYSTVYSGADQRKHESSASLAFVWGIHWGSVNYPHKWPLTRKMFPFDDVIMLRHIMEWSSMCLFCFLHIIADSSENGVVKSNQTTLMWCFTLVNAPSGHKCTWKTSWRPVFKTVLQDGYEDLKTLTDPSFWRRIFKVPKTSILAAQASRPFQD